MINECSACGSNRLARGHVALERWRWPVAFYAPGGFLGRGKPTSGLRATACADCGNVQLVANDLEPVGHLHEEQRRDSLQLSD